MVDFPRCSICRVAIEPGQNVMFRTDGRVAHVDCPEVVCPVCTRKIVPGDPIRRNGEEMLHGNCWVKRHRAMAGGCADSPWTVVFERRTGARAHIDPRASAEFLAAVRDVRAEARALREDSALTRAHAAAIRRVLAAS